MLSDIQTGIPLGFLLSFMVGPVFFILLETGALKGFRAAISFNLGVILADVLFIILAYFSSFQLLDNLSNEPGLFVFGGAVLVVYSLVMFVKSTQDSYIKFDSKKLDSSDLFSLFIKGFLLNFINVGVLVFWLGIIVIIGPTLSNDSGRITVFFGSVLFTYFVVDIFKILLAKQFKSKLTIRRILFIKRLVATIIFICGLVLIFKGFAPTGYFNLKAVKL